LSLYKQIEVFINNDFSEIKEFLSNVDDNFEEKFQFNLVPIARKKCKLSLKGNKYVVEISKGLLFRLCFIFELINQLWKTNDLRSKVVAVSADHALDEIFNPSHTSSDEGFFIAEDLIHLFSDRLGEDNLWEYIRKFERNFNENLGNAKLKPINFFLPSNLSPGTKKRLFMCVKFLILHEFNHFKKKHMNIINNKNFLSLPEVNENFLKKALEIDADSEAMFTLLNHELQTSSDIDISMTIEETLNTIYILLSSFDMGNRSFLDYFQENVPNPTSEIRALCIIYLIKEKFSEININLPLEFLITLRDRAIEYVVRSFQFLTIIKGTFSIYLSNRMTAIEDNCTSNVLGCLILQDEVSMIEKHYRRITTKLRIDSNEILWQIFPPFKMNMDEFLIFCRRLCDSLILQLKDKKKEIDITCLEGQREDNIPGLLTEEKINAFKKEYNINSEDSFFIFFKTTKHKSYNKDVSASASNMTHLAMVRFLNLILKVGGYKIG